MLRVAERGECAVSPFLTPRSASGQSSSLPRAGVTESAVFWGGYTGAERRRLYLLPSYLLSVPELLPPQDTDPVTNPAGVVGREDAVAAVRIEGSGFRELTHRDYLGSLLSLGLERDVLGDIAVQDAHTAVVFCTARVAEFLPGALERVASDRVRCRIYLPDADFTDGRRTVPVSDTVASSRLDCVVAALTGKSRESAEGSDHGRAGGGRLSHRGTPRPEPDPAGYAVGSRRGEIPSASVRRRNRKGKTPADGGKIRVDGQIRMIFYKLCRKAY